jgi:hypothetical protein
LLPLLLHLLQNGSLLRWTYIPLETQDSALLGHWELNVLSFVHLECHTANGP